MVEWTMNLDMFSKVGFGVYISKEILQVTSYIAFKRGKLRFGGNDFNVSI